MLAVAISLYKRCLGASLSCNNTHCLSSLFSNSVPLYVLSDARGEAQEATGATGRVSDGTEHGKCVQSCSKIRYDGILHINIYLKFQNF